MLVLMFNELLFESLINTNWTRFYTRQRYLLLAGFSVNLAEFSVNLAGFSVNLAVFSVISQWVYWFLPTSCMTMERTLTDWLEINNFCLRQICLCLWFQSVVEPQPRVLLLNIVHCE